MESIYNLIPQPQVQVQKEQRYKSKYDPRAKPAGSTFCTNGTSALPGAGLGQLDATNGPGSGQHMATANMGTFGSALGRAKPNPSSFIRKGERTGKGADPRNKPASYIRPDVAPKKTQVPARDDRPVMGLQSTKNYVTANAVEAILAVPGNRAAIVEQQPVYRTKVDYGKVPAYLGDVKEEIHRENEMIENYLKSQEEPEYDDQNETGEVMNGNERDMLVDALKTKWDVVNAKYQKICHMVKLDTIGKVRRKEAMENELIQLEKDIERLENRQVIIQ